MDEPNALELPFLHRGMFNLPKNFKLQLRLVVYSAIAGSLVVHGFTKSSIIKGVASYSGSLSGAVSDFEIDDFPIYISVFDELSLYHQKECFVGLYIMINGDIVSQLSSGYVGRTNALTYPAGLRSYGSFDTGCFKEVLIGAPGAGSNYSWTQTEFVKSKLLGGRFTLLTDANVANRRVHITLNDSSGVYTDCYSSIDQAAGVTYTYVFAPFPVVQTTANNNIIQIPIPPGLCLHYPYGLQTAILNIQAGDTLSSCRMQVEEFLDQ
jgi:hypothetical protein